jgi:hypothetical protein
VRIQTVTNTALGNGTRPAGFLLADCECDDVDKLFDAVARARTLAELPATFTLAESVTETEVLCALNNPHLASLFDVPNAASDSEPPADADNSEHDEDAEPGDVLAMPVSSLKVSKRIADKLAAADVETIGDLEKFDSPEQVKLTAKEHETLLKAIASLSK